MMQLPTVGARIGGFEIEAQIGQGGMGVVYLAEQTSLQRKVALKVIAPHLSEDEGFRMRFEREARLAASLDHPNVVPVFEAGSADGLLYLAMRFVRGTDLAAVLATREALDPERACSITDQLGAALDAAHGNGLIHRDVKPANVLLAGDAPDAHVYLTDFGLTKEASSQSTGLTHTGQWVGTVDYIAPEQLDGRAADARTDVYALGCVLFQMLTGHVPFTGTLQQKMFGHSTKDVPSLTDIAPELVERFDPVLERAMAKDPDDRYLSAGDLGRAALAAARGEAVDVPERSVASGEAAEGRVEDEASTDVIQPSAVQTRGQPMPSPNRTAAGPLPPPPGPAVTAAPATPPPPARRSRLLIPLAILALLAVGVGGGVVLASRGDDSDPSPPAQPAADVKPEKPDPAPPTTPPESAAPSRDSTTVGFRSYTPSTSGYTTEIPSGGGWGEPIETQPTPGRLYRTKINGPDGAILIIDYTPTEPASFGGAADTQQVVSQPAFGTATEYIFSGGRIHECAASMCVDYIVNDTERGGGYGVLGGGGSDFETAKDVANHAMRTLRYNDS